MAALLFGLGNFDLTFSELDENGIMEVNIFDHGMDATSIFADKRLDIQDLKTLVKWINIQIQGSEKEKTP